MQDESFNNEELKELINSYKSDLPELGDESLKLDRSNHELATNTFNNLLVKFNEKHGLDLKINFADFFDNMTMLSEGNNRRLMELYLSETWQDFRTVFFMRILQCLVLLANKIATPERLGDISTTVESDMDLIDKLFGFISRISTLGRDIGIFDVDNELTRIKKLEQVKGGQIDKNSPEVAKILQQLKESLGYK